MYLTLESKIVYYVTHFDFERKHKRPFMAGLFEFEFTWTLRKVIRGVQTDQVIHAMILCTHVSKNKKSPYSFRKKILSCLLYQSIQPTCTL